MKGVEERRIQEGANAQLDAHLQQWTIISGNSKYYQIHMLYVWHLPLKSRQILDYNCAKSCQLTVFGRCPDRTAQALRKVPSGHQSQTNEQPLQHRSQQDRCFCLYGL